MPPATRSGARKLRSAAEIKASRTAKAKKSKTAAPAKATTTRPKKGIAVRKVAAKKGKGKKGKAKATKSRKGKKVEKEQSADGEAEDETEEAEEGDDAPSPEKIYNQELGEYGMEYEAEVIRDSKLDKKKNRHYLVKWVGWPESSNTWEPEVNLHNSSDLIAIFDTEFPDKP